MINALFAGLGVFGVYLREIVFLVLSGLSVGAVFTFLLFRDQKENVQLVYVLLLGFAGLGILAPVFSFFGILNRWALVLVIVIGAGAFYFLYRRNIFSGWGRLTVRNYVWLPLGIFVFFLFLRLAYLDNLILPPYSDAPEHFLRVKELLSGDFLLESLSPYYHWGFHGIVAWVQVGTGNESPLVMTLVSQFFLALLPVSVYMMTLAFLENIHAASFSALLAGIGWIVPANSAHFSKYPALVGVSLFPLFFGLCWSVFRKKNMSDKWVWGGYLFFMGISMMWLHSRLFFIIVAFLAAYFMTELLKKQWEYEKNFIDWTVGFVALAILGMMALSYEDAFSRNFRYYFGLFSGATFLVISVLSFAFKKNSEIVSRWFFFSLFWVLATLIPLPQEIYRYELTLIDSPFFELSFFLPLALLGGVGIKGIQDSLSSNDAKRILVFLFAIVFVNGAITPQPWGPVFFTNYVSLSDQMALDWVEKSTGEKAFVVISAVEKDGYLRGADAGVWVKTVNDVIEIKLPFAYRWDIAEASQAICDEVSGEAPIYVYKGAHEYSFPLPICGAISNLTPVFCDEQVSIYFLNCSSAP